MLFANKKAASTAISLMVRYPEESELVEAMIALAQEELSHFEMVHQLLRERGLGLGQRTQGRIRKGFTAVFP